MRTEVNVFIDCSPVVCISNMRWQPAPLSSNPLDRRFAGQPEIKGLNDGARNVNQIQAESFLPQVSRELLSRMAHGGGIKKAIVDLDDAFSFQLS